MAATDSGADTPLRMMEPPVGPESAEFWEATRDGRLLVQWCTACDKVIFYPRAFCPGCGRTAVGEGGEWRTASGKATIHSFTIEHNPAATGATFSGGEPYVVALVELAEGPRLLSNIVGVPPAAVTCEMPVKVVFDDVAEGISLPKFAPRDAPAA